jgi:hypothetical protein
MIKQVKLKVTNTQPVPTGDIQMRRREPSDRAVDSTSPATASMGSVPDSKQYMFVLKATPPKPKPFILRGWNREES